MTLNSNIALDSIGPEGFREPLGSVSKPRILLHICCGPCAAYPFTKLADEYDVTAYFYDPNIHPESEYRMRLEEAKKYFSDKCEVIEGPYDPETFFERAKGLENEPEKGKRCAECFDIRLTGTAQFAAENGFETFTTALTISPHKDSEQVNTAGKLAAIKYGISYLDNNWKKQNGYLLGTQLSRAAGLKRQDYCGCIYSRRDRDKKNEEKNVQSSD